MTETGKKYIKNGDFCFLVTNKFAKTFGMNKGDKVYVAGHKALPISDSDPYTQRIKFFVHTYKDNKMGQELLLVDPRSIKRFDDETQATMLEEYKTANGIN
jgi:hypothetical protein